MCFIWHTELVVQLLIKAFSVCVCLCVCEDQRGWLNLENRSEQENSPSLVSFERQEGGRRVVIHVTHFHSAEVTWVGSAPLSRPGSKAATFKHVCDSCLARPCSVGPSLSSTADHVLCSRNNAAAVITTSGLVWLSVACLPCWRETEVPRCKLVTDQLSMTLKTLGFV